MADPAQTPLIDRSNEAINKQDATNAPRSSIRAVKSSTATDLSDPISPSRSPVAGHQDAESMYNPYERQSHQNTQDYQPNTGLYRQHSLAETVSPIDSVSNYDASERYTAVNASGGQGWQHQDPYANNNLNSPSYYPQRSLNPYEEQEDDSRDYSYSKHYRETTDELPLVHHAGKAGEYQPEQERHLYDLERDVESSAYPPPMLLDEKRKSGFSQAEQAKRPSVWLRIWRDTTPIEQRIENHSRFCLACEGIGLIGIQNGALACNLELGRAGFCPSSCWSSS